MKLLLRILVALNALLIISSSVAEACTEIFLNKGANKVSARNFDYDYPKDTQSMVVINLRNVHRKSITTDSSDIPLEWVSKYGSVSINVLPEKACSEGLNEHGLTASLLFLNETKYPKKDERPVLSYNF